MVPGESANIQPLDVLYLDPFHGGSHAAVATGLARHSRHRVEIMSLPARAWKWRMRGAAIWFAERLTGPGAATPPVDVIMTTDMLSAADLRALLPAGLARRPLVVYFHENQLTYPDRRNEPRDQHFSFTNLTSALAADQIWFNSEFHRQSFTEALPAFLARMPDHAPRSAAAAIATRSRVVAPGIDLPEPPDGGIHDPGFRPPPAGSGEDPLILWNHRWEHDKDPDTFFATLEEVRRRGGRFRLAVVGQRFRRMPSVFRYLTEVFGDVLEVCGPLERDAYCRLLGRSDIVISAARHEFFGISVLEAIAGGAYPLLPDRLSYPEIIPAEQHPAHLYADQPDLEARLLHLLDQHPVPRATELGHHVRETYAWPRRAAAFDAALAECAAAPAR